MTKPLRKTHPVLKPINRIVIDLPAPRNLSIWWNFGSLLGLCLTAQLATGLFLAIHYIPHTDLAFQSVGHICRDVNQGWLLRALHANGASIFFICLYLHVGRGIYYGSYLMVATWNLGVIIFLATIASAFLGYVLPWGQISFWAATVITNFFSALPYIGTILVQWIWGGFAVGSATLTRFFTFHFLVPFILIALRIIHLLFLHQTGSNNPTGTNRDPQKIPFHPYYTSKDTLGFIILFLALAIISLLTPYLFTEPENFIPANPLSTPLHIKPEWYFLWAYTVLRSVPNKLGGVAAILAGILGLFLLPDLHPHRRQLIAHYPPTQSLFWSLVATTLLLTWIGGKPVELPYEPVGQTLTTFYFSLFFLQALSSYFWDRIIDTSDFNPKHPASKAFSGYAKS